MNKVANRARGASVWLAGLGLAVTLLPGEPVQACGGFFCNQPQNPFDPLPVAQTAENVLFAMDRDATGAIHLEAHVQIFYQGPADRFSWVVPVDNKPELDVGTNRLFAVLDPATRPSFGVNWQEEGTCKVDGAGGSGGRGGTGGSGGSGGIWDAGAAADGAAGGVEIGFRGDVGPYDAVVIRSSSPDDPRPLKEWLEMNMYYLSPEGSTLIDDYVRENKWFVAIRLVSGRSVNEIQPLVMRFDGPSPCIPLKLTSIASINDLRVNLWVLAETRVVPENYYEIKINPVRIDWFNAGRNYDDLVKQAANEAGGNAFVADFVGPASIMRNQIYNGTYNTTALGLARTPPDAINELLRQGFPRDATLLEILRKHIPLPQALRDRGVSELQFYNQLALYWQTDRALFAPFNAGALAADVQAKIVLPLAKAQALFDRFPKLTRLSTFISPDEMTYDPLFMGNTTLPDLPARRVSNAYIMCGQRQYTRCNAPVRLELPDGQQVFFAPRASTGPCYGAVSPLDRGQLDKLPALQVSYQRAAQGEGAVKVSREVEIQQALAAHNVAARAQVMVGAGGAGGSAGAGGAGAGGAGGSAGMGMGMGGAGGSWTGTDPSRKSSSSGCALTGGDGSSGLALLALLGVARLVWRRRRH
jgi:MYXO-CTERM domain-containing protein